MLHTIRKLLAGLLISCCLCGLNVAGCTTDIQDTCSAMALECGNDASYLDNLIESDLKTVAIY